MIAWIMNNCIGTNSFLKLYICVQNIDKSNDNSVYVFKIVIVLDYWNYNE